MTIPHGTGWAGIARHRAAHDTRERINTRNATIAALQHLNATDEELLHNLEEQTA